MSKQTPKFWWKFDLPRSRIVVESDDPEYPVVKMFSFALEGNAKISIDLAQKLIKDLDAGREDYRRLAKET